MKSIFNECNFYTLLWCVFHLKGWLYQGDMISVAAYAIIMVMSLYYTVVVVSKQMSNTLIKSYSILLFLFVVYGAINILFFDNVYTLGHVTPTDFYLQNILKSMLPFYAYFHFTRKGYINKKWLCYVGAIFLLVCIPRFLVAERQMMGLMMSLGKQSDEVTNNAGYFFCALIPLLCFWNKKPLLQYIAFGACTFFVLSGMKRGAILVAGISLFFYFFYSMGKKSKRNRLITLTLVAAFFIFAYFFFQEMLQSSDYFAARYQSTIEGNTSSRNVLYEDFWNKFWNPDNAIAFILGRGADATIRYGSNYAHNDWLEIAMNQGVFGILIFAYFWKKLYQFWKTTKLYPVLYTAVGVCAIQMFSKTFFSMSINDMQIYITCVLGYAVAVMSMSNSKPARDLLA